jgi:hypothetical protein
MYKLHIKKFMKENKLTKEELSKSPNVIIPPLTIKTGLFKSQTLNLRQIESEIEKA